MRRRRASDELRDVYQRHVDAVYAFFAYAVSDSTAEDLTAATFERVVRAWSSYDPERAGERTWILAIARNLLTDHYRRSAHRDTVSTDAHPAYLERAALSDELDWVLDADELRDWLAPLGERAREVVALRYASDLSANEIAELLGLSSSNVHQILSRSVRALRQTIEPTPARAGRGGGHQ